MARPTNKQDLIVAANSRFDKLWKQIDSMPEEKRTGTTNLGSYCISATSSHYDWAMKKLKQHGRNSDKT